LPRSGRRCSTSETIIEYTRYGVPADRAEAFEAAYRRAAAHLAAAPECHDFELTKGDGDYVVRLTWAAEPDGFRAGPHFAPWSPGFHSCGPVLVGATDEVAGQPVER
jgi:hypothetical protein